jgi:hypothetical protein
MTTDDRERAITGLARARAYAALIAAATKTSEANVAERPDQARPPDACEIPASWETATTRLVSPGDSAEPGAIPRGGK